MTFPATYNINYYMGDTHEFNVYPKDSSGAAFPLTGFTEVKFVIAPTRGTLASPTDAVEGYATFSSDKTYIECAITPEAAAYLDPDASYVYDVKISQDSTPYNLVHTLITGDITLQGNVEDVQQQILTVPNPPTAIVETEISDNFISISWGAPTEGPTPDGYYIYVFPYSAEYEDFQVLGNASEAIFAAVPFTTVDTSYTITAIMDIETLGIVGGPLLPGNAYLYSVIAFNEVGNSLPTGNFNFIDTINETYTAGGS